MMASLKLYPASYFAGPRAAGSFAGYAGMKNDQSKIIGVGFEVAVGTTAMNVGQRASGAQTFSPGGTSPRPSGDLSKGM
jgi:hypothetical protein